MFASEELNSILKAELERGNKVSEESAWPPKCRKLVILKDRFHKPYETQSLDFRVINDRHYWYAEYNSNNGAECLACGF